MPTGGRQLELRRLVSYPEHLRSLLDRSFEDVMPGPSRSCDLVARIEGVAERLAQGKPPRVGYRRLGMPESDDVLRHLTYKDARIRGHAHRFARTSDGEDNPGAVAKQWSSSGSDGA
jgi:hypothetical protein